MLHVKASSAHPFKPFLLNTFSSFPAQSSQSSGRRRWVLQITVYRGVDPWGRVRHLPPCLAGLSSVRAAPRQPCQPVRQTDARMDTPKDIACVGRCAAVVQHKQPLQVYLWIHNMSFFIFVSIFIIQHCSSASSFTSRVSPAVRWVKGDLAGDVPLLESSSVWTRWLCPLNCKDLFLIRSWKQVITVEFRTCCEIVQRLHE